MKTVAFIRAKGRNERLPGKHLAALGNGLLIDSPLREACNSELVDQVIMSTDSNQIGARAALYGLEVFHQPSPPEGMDEHTTGSLDKAILDEYAKRYPHAAAEGIRFVTVPGWEYYHRDGLIDDMIRWAEGQDGHRSIMTMVAGIEVHAHPYDVVTREEGLLTSWCDKMTVDDSKSRTACQLWPKVFLLFSGPQLNYHPALSTGTRGLVIKATDVIHIDNEDNLNYARFLWEQKNQATKLDIAQHTIPRPLPEVATA